MGDIIRLGVVLMVVCAVSAAALALTHAQTEPIIEEQRQLALEANLRGLLPEADRFEEQEVEDEPDDEEKKDTTFYLGYKGEELVGVAALFSQGGYGGDIRMMFGLDNAGEITGVRIVDHVETPGLGAKIEEEWFLGQFAGKGVDDPLAVGEDIEAITGATISTRAVVGGIKLMAGEIEREFLGGAAAPTVDLAQVPDGTYQGEGEGFVGKIRVEVQIEDGRLVGVDVVEHNDTPDIAGSAVDRVPDRMIENQEIQVDAVTGATYTSRGIMDAVTDALSEFAAPAE